MSVIVDNYSQFYKGTEKVKQYGSGAGGKDTLVRYEFNTKDAAGNKVMDKMSREETLQAMKEISSQYGDNVIVEFSGDGMAKLIESQKGYLSRELSEEEIAARKTDSTNNLLEKLRKTYGNIDFYVSGRGTDPKSLLAGSTKEYSVIFSAEEWEKMLSDENYAKEKMQSIDKVLQMTKKICEQEGYVSAFGKANQESVLNSVSISVGDDGKMTIFAELEKMTEKQKERIEEAKDKNAEAKKNKDEEKVVKKTTVKASSVEELLEKIKNIDWRDIKKA